jgi:hypothetical protein
MNAIAFFVKVGDVYHKCFIFRNGPRYQSIKGCGGMEMIITMSNGWKIKTNDLWYDKIHNEIEPDSIIGTVSVNSNNEITDESYIYI